MAKNKTPKDRKINRTIDERALTDAIGTISEEGTKRFESDVSGLWTDLNDWNEEQAKIEYGNHALFLRGTMLQASVPAYMIDKVFGGFYQDPRFITPEDLELPSAIQRGMMISNNIAEEDAAAFIDAYMAYEGYSAAARAAAIATYNEKMISGNVELAVAAGVHAYDPETEPTVDEYVAQQGEYYGVTPDQYPENAPPYDPEALSAFLAQYGMAAEHAGAMKYALDMPGYKSLIDELARAGASQQLLESIVQGSDVDVHNQSGISPSMGAAIMGAIRGRSVINDERYSALDKLASERARLEYERTGDPVAATKAGVDAVRAAKSEDTGQAPMFGKTNNDIADQAFQGYRDSLMEGSLTVEDGNYAGASQEVSPEDRMTVEQNRQQLERNTNLLQERRAAAEKANPEASAAASAPRVTRAGASQLYGKLADIYSDPAAAQNALRATLPERTAIHDFDGMLFDAVDGLKSVLGGAAPTPARGRLESAKVAGLVMDQPMVDKAMRAPAYAAKDDFAVNAVKSYYDHAYADNNPAAPKRQSPLEEPKRKAEVEKIERLAEAAKVTERHNAQIARENAAIDAERAAEEAARTQRVRETAASEEIGAQNAVPTRTVDVAKVDKLGGNAVSAAQATQAAEEAAAQPTPRPVARVAPDEEDKPASQENLAKPQALKPQRGAVAPGRTGAAANSRVGGAYKGPGSDWDRNPDGTHKSSTRANGTSRGGSRVDKYGNEVGHYGQQTMDIIGRGDGSRGAGNTRVICTELVRQGRMAPSLQRLDIAFTLRALSPATVRGYHVWAVPYVRVMRRSPLATALIEPLATWRALEIAHQMGERDQPHWRGKLVRAIMEPACWLIGHAAALLPGDPDRFHPYLTGGR